MSPIDRWAVVEGSFATWRALVPPQREAHGFDAFWRLAAAVVEAGAETDVYRILLRRPGAQEDEPFDYLAWLREDSPRTLGLVPYFTFDVDDSPPGGTLVEAGAVCLDEGEGGSVRRRADDLGAVLRSRRAAEAESRPRYAAHQPAVALWGARLSGPGRELPDRPVGIRLDLPSDIWFPRVAGLLEAVEPDAPDWYDNSSLARCHTPDLNRFLGRIRSATHEVGGTWLREEPDGIAIRYAHMVGEAEILLEG